MIYRVVEMSDGMFKCQFRLALFWWADSYYDASADLVDQQRYARAYTTTNNPKPPRPRTVRVVAPIQDGDGR